MAPQTAKGNANDRATHKRTTLAQVAKASGYSASTVSAVLNNRRDCWASQDTRQRVIDAAEKLGYRPNHAARVLRGAATQTLGLITEALNVSVSAAKVQAFEQAARLQGYTTMIAFCPNDVAVEDRLLQSLVNRHVDGIAVFPAEHGPNEELTRLADRGFPIVTIEGHARFACDDVSTDLRAAGRLQAQSLVEAGRTKLCQLNTFPSCHAKDELRQGLIDGAREAGLEPPTLVDLQVAPDAGEVISEADMAQVCSFLQAHRQRIDAVASYDLMAMATLKGARALGLNVPNDLAIIGSDATPVARSGLVEMTTVSHQADAIGRLAFEMLQERIARSVREAPRHQRIAPILLTGETA